MREPIEIRHPAWCDPSQYCTAAAGGWHRSVPIAASPDGITGQATTAVVQTHGHQALVVMEVTVPDVDGTPIPEPAAVLPLRPTDARRLADALRTHADLAEH